MFPCPPGPASLSRNHKAELSPVLAVGGACGQEPCKQMSADDDHAGYLRQIKANRSKHMCSDLMRLLYFQAKDIIWP